MVKVTYKNKDGNIVKFWFSDAEEACYHVLRILKVTNGFVKVEAFKEVTVE